MKTTLKNRSRGSVAGIRLLLGLAVLMMMTPAFLYLAGPLRNPMMVDGDRMEDRTCPECGGVKKDCPRCRGRGVVPHVIPGPLRPTEITGHIYQTDETTAVPQASVSIQVDPLISLKTDEQGRFGVTLPPGNYTMAVETPQGVFQNSLHVDVLTKPTPADIDLTFPKLHQAFFLQPKK